MKEYGYIRGMAAVPEVKVGDVDFNVGKIIEEINKAIDQKVDVLVFPELSVTGYTCGDLFLQSLLIKKAEEGVAKIIDATKGKEIFVAVGAPVINEGSLYNCAIAIADGKIEGIVPKTYIPNYNEFYEKRWFRSGSALSVPLAEYCGREILMSTQIYFLYKGVRIGIEICEDLWVPNPPSDALSLGGCELILNLSASDSLVGKREFVENLVRMQSARDICGYIYASAGPGESSSDLVFEGMALIGVNGKLKSEELNVREDIDIEKLKLDRIRLNSFFDNRNKEKKFVVIRCGEKLETDNNKEEKSLDNCSELYPRIDRLPFVPDNNEKLSERCHEIIGIQTEGLARRLKAINCQKVVVGISGGLDSTLALLVSVSAFDKLGYDRKGIIGITMPGLATTGRTKSNALQLMELLGVTILEIPIGAAMAVHFKDIGQDPNKYDVTFENSQARERTQILMDVANKENAIVVGTGDMSELALGWCTYNGDHMSMYGVNAGVPKTLVRHLVSRFAAESDKELERVLTDIIKTPISPELVPSENDDISQKTEDLVGPYELHDFFLYHFLRNSYGPRKILWLAEKAFAGEYSGDTILKWLKVFYRRFFSQQFKRDAMPDGPKVGSVSLSPRGDWRMPSDASVNLWLKELE